jgi:hypothetical protein
MECLELTGVPLQGVVHLERLEGPAGAFAQKPTVSLRKKT